MPRRPPSRTSSADSSSVSWSLPSSASSTCTEDQRIPLSVGGSCLSKLRCLNQCLLMVFLITFLVYGWVTVQLEMKNMMKSHRLSDSLFHQEELMILMEHENANKTDHGWSNLDSFHGDWDMHRTSTPPLTASITQPSWSSTPVLPSSNQSPSLRFCKLPSIEHNNVTLNLLYQCEGENYINFGRKLAQFAHQKSSSFQNHSSLSQWGRRDFPIPANRTVLLLGNSHLRQISKTVVCQFSDVIQSIQILPSLDPSDDKQEVFGVQFMNGSRWISITNTVLAYSKQWYQLILQDDVSTLLGGKGGDHTIASMIDSVVFGKFTRYSEAIGSSYIDSMSKAASAYYERHPAVTGPNRVEVDFFSTAPPTLLEAAIAFKSVGGMISVPMFSASDQDRAQFEWNEYQDALANASVAQSTIDTKNTFIIKHVSLLKTREFIEEVGLECGSDDRMTIGTCHESEVREQAMNASNPGMKRRAAEMHRCAGAWGGHADLVAWSLVEELHRGKNAT